MAVLSWLQYAFLESNHSTSVDDEQMDLAEQEEEDEDSCSHIFSHRDFLFLDVADDSARAAGTSM